MKGADGLIKVSLRTSHKIPTMSQEYFNLSWRFLLFWALAFLAFPIGGWLANVIVGPVTNSIPAGIAGAIAGAVLGVIQYPE